MLLFKLIKPNPAKTALLAAPKKLVHSFRYIMPPRTRSPAARRAPPTTAGVKVALAGSGGGSTRRADAHEEVSALRMQLDALGASLAHVQLISCELPLDRASPDSMSELWTLVDGASLSQSARGALRDVNAVAAATDQQLADAIDKGEVAALLLVSADVAGVNKRALAAAVRRRVPVCGTGGASLGMAAEAGALLLEVSGSVGTTSHTRAIAVACALARHWGRPAYTPALKPPELAPLPLLDALLPAFLACLLVGAAGAPLRSCSTTNVADGRLGVRGCALERPLLLTPSSVPRHRARGALRTVPSSVGRRAGVGRDPGARRGGAACGGRDALWLPRRAGATLPRTLPSALPAPSP